MKYSFPRRNCHDVFALVSAGESCSWKQRYPSAADAAAAGTAQYSCHIHLVAIFVGLAAALAGCHPSGTAVVSVVEVTLGVVVMTVYAVVITVDAVGMSDVVGMTLVVVGV